MNPAVFFDKDGILNEIVLRGSEISSPRIIEEFRIMDNAAEMVKAARKAGFRNILATNQPDIERGLMTKETLQWILNQVSKLGINAVEVSFDGTLSDRRSKPNPGMLLDAAAAYEIDLSRSFFVGDSWRDVEAAKNAGVKSILLRTSYNMDAHGSADWDFNSLREIGQFLSSTARDLAFGKQ